MPAFGSPKAGTVHGIKFLLLKPLAQFRAGSPLPALKRGRLQTGTVSQIIAASPYYLDSSAKYLMVRTIWLV